MGENLEDKISKEDISPVNAGLGAILAAIVIATLSLGGKVFQNPSKINQNYTPKKIEQQYNSKSNNPTGYVIPENKKNLVYRVIKIEPKQTIWEISSSYLEGFVEDYKNLSEKEKDILIYNLTEITLKFNKLNWNDAKKLKPGEKITLPELYYIKNNKTLLIFAKDETYVIKLQGG